MDEIIKLSDLTSDPNNANKGTDRGRELLEDSLHKFGAGRSILLDKEGRIIAGNKTAEAAQALGIDDVVIVRTSGDKVVAVLREDLDLADGDKARLLAYYDNRVGELDLQWDAEAILADVNSGLDLGALFQIEDTKEFNVDIDFGDLHEEMPVYNGVPDALWASDNDYGIPLLDITKQGDACELPVEIWGAKKRGTNAGTVLFYTEDYRFKALWESPQNLVNSSPIVVGEPNFSVYKDFPLAIAIYQTYQKRWLARYWQSRGIKILVDLNVNPAYYDVNMLGVPDGWSAYCTRGYSSRLEYTQKEMESAKQKAGHDSVLFVVYGGGESVKNWCQSNGAAWISEDMDRAKGLHKEIVYKA